MASSIYSMEGATGKPIVVPRLNMAMTAQRLSISTFNGGDSISERLHDEKRRRPFVSSNNASTNFDSNSRHNTIDRSGHVSKFGLLDKLERKIGSV